MPTNQSKNDNYDSVKTYVQSQNPSRQILTPEGSFVSVFNKRVSEWVKSDIDRSLFEEIRSQVAPSLHIELNAKGFAPAATQSGKEVDNESNYDAIWVRDNVWVYFSLLEDASRVKDARRLLLALWDYYATAAQIERFRNVIADPALAQDEMAVPHIRFDSNSPTLGDVMINGKPQVWNHRQIDAHGIFFTALGEAIVKGIVKPDDLTDNRFTVLSLYPLFLTQIEFYQYEDAGAWEEIPRKNSSSIGLVTRSLQVWSGLLFKEDIGYCDAFRKIFNPLLLKSDNKVKESWSKQSLTSLMEQGLKTVKYQLSLGGESPDYHPKDIHFRLADAALLFLIVPSPLEGLSEMEMRKVLLIVETLQRPMGILRYQRDSYQDGNFWLQQADNDKQAKAKLTDDTSSNNAFLQRLSELMPNTETEWFFDSIAARARLYMASITQDPSLQRQDLHFATIHLKRALGQMTGEGMITADGKAVGAWEVAESVNSVVFDDAKYYLPSPIIPLNWAKVGLSMALDSYKNTFSN